MTTYQKAIKVRKECETQKVCGNCPYKDHCLKSNILFFEPSMEDLKEIAKVIVIEKWNVK